MPLYPPPGSGGATEFTDLTDVPASYTGEAGNSVKVNATEDGLEFFTPGGGGTIASTTNLLQGDGAGNAIASEFVEYASPSGWQLEFNENAVPYFGVKNTNSGNAAKAINYAYSDFAFITLQATSSGFTTNGVLAAGQSHLFASPSDKLIIGTDAHDVMFCVNFSGDGTPAQSAKFDYLTGGSNGMAGFVVGSSGTAVPGEVTSWRAKVGTARSISSGASATLDDFRMPAATTTVTGTTQITTAKGFNKASIYLPTITDSSSVTIDQAASLYIEGAPLAAGSVTITNPYALWVDSGTTRLDGNLVLTGTGGSNHVLKQTSAGGAVTSGAVTFAELAAGTTTATMTLGENTSIALDPAGSADGKYSGITVAGTGGATIAFGDLVTLDKDDSRWELVDISVAAAATGDARGLLGMAVTSSTDGGAITVLLVGNIRADAAFPALTIGAPVHASTTGDVVVAQPSTTDHVIRIIGYGLTADEMFFNPSSTWITHT